MKHTLSNALLHVPLLVHLVQVEALEERMSHFRGELAAKEEQLTQVSPHQIFSQVKKMSVHFSSSVYTISYLYYVQTELYTW